MAWPPIGIAIADVIGRLTGCATYAVSCDGSDPLLPWLGQAAVVGVLLLATPLARGLAGGTIGLVAGLVPATAFLIAFGGAGPSGGGSLLAVFGVVAWLIGVAWATRFALTRVTAPEPGREPGPEPKSVAGDEGPA